MIKPFNELTDHPDYLDQWIELMDDSEWFDHEPSDREAQLLEFKDNLDVKYRFRIDYSIYDFLIYPMEVEEKCPPHFHMHRRYTNYANDICVRLDKPFYFQHNSKHPVRVPDFMEERFFYVGNEAYPENFLSDSDKKYLNDFMHAKSDEFPEYSNWRMLVEAWNYHCPRNRMNVYTITEDDCPDYTQLIGTPNA